MQKITIDTNVEDLVKLKPEILSYLMKKGLCGLRCGVVEPGSIGTLAKGKNFSPRELDEILDYLNQFCN